jgi:hypothetical protein
MSKNRWIAFCLLAALCLGLLIPSVLAEDTIFFTAVNNTLLELTADTMPVNHQSYIYVPCSVFNSQALNTWAYYSRGSQTVLISDGTRELYFDMSTGDSHDREENSYRYAAIYLNDTAYVPAFFVADFFGLTYSYIRREGWHIVRITSGGMLSDDDFFKAAAPLMETRMNQYLGTQETPDVQPTEAPTATPAPPTPTPTPAADRSEVRVHLCFVGLGEETASILESLDGTPACFFATAEEIYAYGDLTRRILGSGCTLGVFLREDPEAEYARFRTALRDVAMTVSYLGAALADGEEEMDAREEGGLVLLRGDEVLTTYWACPYRLENAADRCDLLLDGDFKDTENLLYLLVRDHYTLEAVTEVTAGR